MIDEAQNGTLYQIFIGTPEGVRLQKINNWIDYLSYSKVVNGAGYFSLGINSNFDTAQIKKDRFISIWRRPVGGAQYLDFRGPLLGWEYKDNPDGSYEDSIFGGGLNHLLQRRIIAYAAGTAQAGMTDQADDMMKAIVKDNLGSDATTARQLSATYFSIQADTSLGTSITMGFAWKKLIDVLRDISNKARTDADDQYFEIQPTGDTAFEFRTFSGQIGADRRTSVTGQPIIFGDTFGNLSQPSYRVDYTDEANFIYAGGTQTGSARIIEDAEDATRSGLSIIARSETFVDARNGGNTSAAVQAEADAGLIEHRPKVKFSARLVSTPRAVYGRDWNYGDRVTVTYRGQQIDCMIRAVTVGVKQDGDENIDASIEAYL
jgi:hypothetical protein